MTIGYNSYQAAMLAGMNPVGYQQATAAPAHMPAPYAPSYTVPIQPAPLPVPAMKVDNYESTRDKNAGDFVAGFFTGAGKAIYDMGHGLFFLGKTASRVITHPIQSAKWLGGVALHAVSHPIQTAEAIVTLPFKVANGIVKPYATAIQQGRYGEALGRLTVDVTVIAASLGNKKPPGGGGGTTPPPSTPTTPTPAPATTASPVTGVVDDAAKVVPGGSVTNNVTSQVGDVLIDKLVNVGDVAPGATVNINIGNVEIGKTVMSGTINASSGGGGAMRTVGKVLENADEVAQVVTPQTTYEVAQAVETVAPALTQTAEGVSLAAQQSRTVGQIIGGGIDTIIQAPGKVFNAIGNGFNKIGNGLKSIGNVVLNPIDAIKGIDPVKTAEWIGNGLRTGADLTARGLVFAAQNPKQALIVAGAVGRGGKAAEDILMEFDLVR